MHLSANDVNENAETSQNNIDGFLQHYEFLPCESNLEEKKKENSIVVFKA